VRPRVEVYRLLDEKQRIDAELDAAQLVERSHAELLDEKQRLDVDIAKVRAQLDAARIAAGLPKCRTIRHTESFARLADPVWFGQATYALRRMGQRSQELQRLLGASRKRLRQTRAATFERAFIDVAREQLDPATLAALFSATHDRVRDEGPSD